MTKYEVQIQFVKASHVPVGDFFNGSSDPYIQAYINHKTDKEISFRTSTCRSTRDPSWQEEDVWHLGGIEEGTLVKLRMLDEDPRKLNNDRLGVSELKLDGLDALCDQEGGKELALKVQKRKASIKVYVLTYTYSWFAAQDLRSQSSNITVKLTVKRDQKNHERPCLIGPIRYDIHFSPMLGRLAGTRDDKSKVACFLGYQIHLRDVPDCRFPYTHKRSEIVMMYSKGVRGALIRRALRSQHATIYGYDSRTIVSSASAHDAAARLLEMTDAASQPEKKMFTYAITPDGCIHFTRTGEQFAINHLSKHAMHSNAAEEVVYSGEFFFVQKVPDNEHDQAEHGDANTAQTIVKDDELVMRIRRGTENIKNLNEEAAQHTRIRDKVKIKAMSKMHRNNETEEKPDNRHAKEHHHEVSEFTMVIDNSSGTFMPDAKDLPKLQHFLESNFPGLKIKAMAQDDPQLKEAKKTRRLQEDDTVYGQGSISSSSSSSISFSDPNKPAHRHPEFHATN